MKKEKNTKKTKNLKMKDLTNEINTYYKISLFFNRYVFILGSLIFSVLIFFLLMQVPKKDVVAYSKSDIFLKSINQEDFNLMNGNSSFGKKKDNRINVKFEVVPSKIKKNNAFLGIGVYKDKKTGIYLPMNSKINYNWLNKKVVNKDYFLHNYIPIMLEIQKNDEKFIKPEFENKSDDFVVNKYELKCMDTALNNSIFCKQNKKNFLNDLIYSNKGFDVNSKFYVKLFNKLDIPEDKKCSLIKEVFAQKYNFKKLKPLIEKNSYCSLDEFEKFVEFFDNVLGESLFANYDFIPKNNDVFYAKFTEQFYYLINQKKIPDHILVSYLKFLENVLDADLMTSDLAYISKQILFYIKDKKSFKNNSKYNTFLKRFNKIISGDKNLRINGLDKYLKGKNKEKLNGDYTIDLDVNNFLSEREKIKSIFKNKYGKMFDITKKLEYDEEKKIVYVEGIIYLQFLEGGKSIEKDLKISFNFKNTSLGKFNISNVNIFDKKIANYLGDIDFNTKSFIDLKSKLQDKLYAPLVKNDYGKIDELTLCEKVSKMGYNQYSCKNGVVSLKVDDIENIKNKLNVYFTLENKNKLNISNIDFNENKLHYVSEETFKEEFNIDLSGLKTFLNKLIIKNNYDINNIDSILNLIIKNIGKKIENKKDELIGMSDNQKIKLLDKFKKFLGVKIDYIRKFDKLYKVYFELKSNNYYIVYDLSKNKIKSIVIFFPNQEEEFVFSKLDISFSSLDFEKLNSFKFEPVEFLKSKNLETYNKYIEYIESSK